MILGAHDVQTMFSQSFLHFGEEPITCSKSSDEDDMLELYQPRNQTSLTHTEKTYRYVTVRRFPLVEDGFYNAVDRRFKEFSNIGPT